MPWALSGGKNWLIAVALVTVAVGGWCFFGSRSEKDWPIAVVIPPNTGTTNLYSLMVTNAGRGDVLLDAWLADKFPSDKALFMKSMYLRSHEIKPFLLFHPEDFISLRWIRMGLRHPSAKERLLEMFEEHNRRNGAFMAGPMPMPEVWMETGPISYATNALPRTYKLHHVLTEPVQPGEK